jgi:mRNA-degrading endonuclease RelE of RelBE toxin-antitoxin system
LHRVVLTRSALETLERAPEHVKRRIAEALDALQQSFAPVGHFDVRRLKGMRRVFTIRIGGWKMIYEVRDRERRGLDRVPTFAPDWTEFNESDLGITLIELFGFLGDEVANYQDQTADEGYVGRKPKDATWRRRKPP